MSYIIDSSEQFYFPFMRGFLGLLDYFRCPSSGDEISIYDACEEEDRTLSGDIGSIRRSTEVADRL